MLYRLRQQSWGRFPMVIEIPRMQNRAGILLLQSRYEIHLPHWAASKSSVLQIGVSSLRWKSAQSIPSTFNLGVVVVLFIWDSSYLFPTSLRKMDNILFQKYALCNYRAFVATHASKLFHYRYYQILLFLVLDFQHIGNIQLLCNRVSSLYLRSAQRANIRKNPVKFRLKFHCFLFPRIYVRDYPFKC